MCTVTCPKGLNPQGAIQELLKMVHEINENRMEEVLWLNQYNQNDDKLKL